MARSRISNDPAIGDRFGRWQIISPGHSVSTVGKPVRYALCKCDCGATREVVISTLRSGASSSCGCLHREIMRDALIKRNIGALAVKNITHGATRGGASPPEYEVYRAIIQRCENPNNPRFADYGGRGVTICAEWRHDFTAFLKCVGQRPGKGYSIDRIENSRGYEPGNVKWSTSHEQMTNRRNTRFVDVDGEMIPLATMAKQYAIPANTLRARILAGWDLRRAFSEPVRDKQPKG